MNASALAHACALPRRHALSWLAFGAASLARAQSFPDRPLHLVVPFAPGGLTDTLGRAVAELMRAALAQPVLVDNRAGAAGQVGAEFVAKGPADGYQWVLLGTGHAGGAVYSPDTVHYRLLKDFAAIGQLGHSPSVIIASKALKVRNLAELIALARARPGQISFAAVQTYTGEYLQSMAGIELNLILYKGAAQATGDLLGDRIDLMLGTVFDMAPLLASGKFEAIALNSPQRIAELPGVAPVAESIPGYRGGQWFGLFAPALTPMPALARLRDALVRVVQSPAYAATLKKLSMLPPDLDVEHFSAEVMATLESFQRARSAGRARLAVSP